MTPIDQRDERRRYIGKFVKVQERNARMRVEIMIHNLSGIPLQSLLPRRVIAEKQVAVLGLDDDERCAQLRITPAYPFLMLLLRNKVTVSIPLSIRIGGGISTPLRLKHDFPQITFICGIITVIHQIRQKLLVDISRIKSVRSWLGQRLRIRNVETKQTGARNVGAQTCSLHIIGDKPLKKILSRSIPLI